MQRGIASSGFTTFLQSNLYENYCRNCCMYYERKPGAISACISINGPYNIGSGVLLDNKFTF